MLKWILVLIRQLLGSWRLIQDGSASIRLPDCAEVDSGTNPSIFGQLAFNSDGVLVEAPLLVQRNNRFHLILHEKVIWKMELNLNLLAMKFTTRIL